MGQTCFCKHPTFSKKHDKIYVKEEKLIEICKQIAQLNMIY